MNNLLRMTASLLVAISIFTILLLSPVIGIAERTSHFPCALGRTLSVPDLLLAGNPVKIGETAGSFKLPATATVVEKGNSIDQSVKAMLSRAISTGKGGTAFVTLETGHSFDDPGLSDTQQQILKSPEAFRLELSSNRAVIMGRSRDGVLRGIATLVLMANRARFLQDTALPAMVMYDAPRMPFRGWLIGHATHSKDDIKRTLDAAYLLRFNKAFIALDTFAGPTPFPFDSLPIGAKGRTKQEWIEVFDYARARGIEPIPYFNAWNGVQYLKTARGGVDLLVDDVNVVHNRSADLADPKKRDVLLGLQEEIIDTLKVRGFLIGLDETHYSHTVTSAAARARNWKPSDWFVEAVRASHGLFERKGVKLYIWGDMLDPEYNGKQLDMTGPRLLARLPKDIAIIDWKYDGSKDFTVDFPSMKMFKGAGFTTMGAPWFKPQNISRMANAIVRNKADGMVLTSWNTTRIDEMKPDLIRAASLAAFYSWSPEDPDLTHLSFFPDAIMEGIAYWTKMPAAPTTTKALHAKDGLIGGDDLMKFLGLPAGISSKFAIPSFKNFRGVGFDIFSKNEKPAAVVVAALDQGAIGKPSASKGALIPVNATARTLTFLHATSHQVVADDMAGMHKKFENIRPGEYSIRYSDGTNVNIPLVYRVNIVAANDPTIGREGDVGIFGAAGGAEFINLQSYTWANPYPDKTIASIEVLPGNSKDMALLVFGVTID